jgi:antimicrobial peptide system SdpB family protein
LTLIFNETGILFRPGSGMPNYPVCQGVGILGIFCNFNPYLEVARWISVIILLVVASGWRPRYTALFHWWISFSLQTSAITVDGGDQVTAVLTFLLLPIALTDKRKWHWQSVSAEENQENIDSFRNRRFVTEIALATYPKAYLESHRARFSLIKNQGSSLFQES